MEKLKKLNELNSREAKDEFIKCCGSNKWIQEMLSHKPYSTKEKLFNTAEKVWYSLEEKDWKEAFTHHPKIGELNSLKKKFISTKTLLQKEQSGINTASIKTLTELAKYNKEYEKKFGYIFIVCATGKSAEEMLSMIKKRINNNPKDEIKIAMQEQFKITKLRLEKLV